MAIEPTMAEVIRRLAVELPNRRALCLGYPDILQPGSPPEDADMQSIARWHHWHGAVQSADAFFAELGLEPEYWDVTRARGPERVVDLNEEPASVRMPWHEFGLIIDPGTIEHIANIGNCWRMICAVTAIGGYVVHANPLNMPNHAFYAVSPTCYADVYEANGFNVEVLMMLAGPLDDRKMYEVPKAARFNAAPNAVMLCVARKCEDVPFSWPRQSKYVLNPMLKAAQ